LLHDIAKLRDALAAFLGKRDLEGDRVSFLVESGYHYVVTLFAIWALGGFAVPLCTTHPVHEMLYTVTDSDSCLLIASEHFESKIRELAELVAKETNLGRAVYIVPQRFPALVSSIPELVESPIASPLRHALMIYTSGTTGKPKV
jgi:acyl-CoA synthetase (AMP-forming)/AMP-acid ligase II